MKRWEKHYPNWLEELKTLKNEHDDLEYSFNSIQEKKRINTLEKRINAVQFIKALHEELKIATQHLQAEKDSQIAELWKEEINKLSQEIETIQANMIESMIPNNSESVIVEIRAGQGGQEAAIFAQELANMYMKLCKKRNWQWKVFSESYSESDGIKEGIFEITGPAVAYWLFSESGVHCVKRVPKTEKKGRIHTSTATIAILKEPEDIEINLNEKDLKIEVFRSSGPGGQSVNTTDSAIRITHIPTGIVVSQQDEKSQHRNKEKAMKILKARIYEKKLAQLQSEQAQNRKNSIGSAQRNERIRTYHFVQNWVNDSRLENMCYDVENFMESTLLSYFIDLLVWENIDLF